MSIFLGSFGQQRQPSLVGWGCVHLGFEPCVVVWLPCPFVIWRKSMSFCLPLVEMWYLQEAATG